MQSNERRDERGFTLIELLIVMSIIIIIATFAIPNIMRIKKQGNETSAINSVQAIVKAQFQYSTIYPQYGFACALSSLGGGAKGTTPGPEAAGLLPDDLTSSHKAGYTFAITNCVKGATINGHEQIVSYEITAVPDKVGSTGDRGFCSDDAQQIKYDSKGGTNCSEPIQ